MQIQLASWRSYGLRCPDVSLDLQRKGSIPAVTLLQMPNGTGKTTTLQLLNATLSGSAEGWTPEHIRRYQRSGDKQAEGRFEVTLLVDNEPLSIELRLNYEEGTTKYQTTSPGSGGVKNGFQVRPSVRTFLTPKFLDLFIFDGEFAGRLLDGNKAEADRVVDVLCQLYLLDDASSFAEEYWKQSKKASTKTQNGLARREAAREKLVKRKAEIKSACKRAKDEIAMLEKRCRVLENKIDEKVTSDKTTSGQYEQAKSDIETAKSDIREKSRDLMSALRMPTAVHDTLRAQLKDLRDSLDKLQLPENTSAQFFQELVDEDECICGRPMNKSAILEIQSRAKQYLDADDAGVINEIKGDIELHTRGEASEENDNPAQVQRLVSDVGDAVRRCARAEQQSSALKKKLDDDELKKWEQEKREKENGLKQLYSVVADIEGAGTTDDPDDKTWSLSLIERRLKEEDDEIAKIRRTVRLREQTRILGGLLENAAIRARDRIKSELVKECNQRLSQILAHDPLRIERIDQFIRLHNQEGASAGQTLAVGYTFLMSVLDRGENNFPLVVDSPAGPLDEGVRRQIGRLLPKLCTQFVGFTINTERTGFVDALQDAVKDISFLTLFRKTPGTERWMSDLPTGKYSETDTGVLVDDRDYFFRFDVEMEEEDINDVV